MAEEGEGRRRTVEDEVMESLEGERSRKSKIAARRRRRHHAAAQGDQVAVPEVVLDERRTEEGRKKEEEAGGRRREKRSGRRTRPEPLPPQVTLMSLNAECCHQKRYVNMLCAFVGQPLPIYRGK